MPSSSFRRSRVLTAAAVALIAAAPLAISAGPAAAAPLSAPASHGAHAPFFLTNNGGLRNIAGLRNTTLDSTNWSGYAAVNSTYTSVSTSFTVPVLNCPVSPDTYASIWAGLGGYTSASLEQSGITEECYGATAYYSAWYELYPAYPVNYSNTVKPGDQITETVAFSGTSTYTLTIQDSTEGWTKTKTGTSPGDARSSAEVIIEDPTDGATLPLADFGTVDFTSSSVNGRTLSSVNPLDFDMVSSSGAPEATVSGLNGGSFSDTWISE